MELKVHFKATSRAILFFCTLLTTALALSEEPNIIFYEISGDSVRALREQLNEKRPKDGEDEGFDGLTQYTIRYAYRYVPTPGGCRFTEFTPTLETNITMPRWNDADLTSELGKKWADYYEALYKHELGHRDIGMNAYKELQEAGRNFSISKSCAAIQDEFNAVYTPIMEKYRQMDRQYDLQTDHGAKSGATFP